jgi:outer membrane protein
MKKAILSVVFAGVVLIAPMQMKAEEGDWVVRLRAASINPNEDSRLGKTVNNLLGATVMSPGAELSVSENLIPEIDISYYFTKNLAAELILATGSEHGVRITDDNLTAIGNQSLGSVDVLPPTLTLQWHLNPDEMFDPYVGAGINYTFMLDRYARGSRGAIAGNKIKIDRDSWGYALQAGLDINLADNWLINADVKYIGIDTDVELRGAATGNVWRKVDSLDIDPWVIGIGLGKKFN